MSEQYVAGVRLSKTSQDKLIKAARESGDALGLCHDVDRVLENMGFTLPPREREIEIIVYVKAKVLDGAEDMFDVGLHDNQIKVDINNPSVKDVEVQLWEHA